MRLSDKAKLVVGRNESENERLNSLTTANDYIFMPQADVAGPICLGRGEFDDELIKVSCQITAHYCDLDKNSPADVIYRDLKRQEKTLKVSPIQETELRRLRI